MKVRRSTSPKMSAIKMQSTSALRQALKPSVFFIIFSLTHGGHILQALGFIWLVREFEIPVGSRHESCTCQGRLVFDLHCANIQLRLCQVIILLFCLSRSSTAAWNNSTTGAMTLTNYSLE